MVIGENYEVVVTERSSSLHGTSEAFELLEQPEEESSSVVEFRHVGGEGGAVGDMNTAMVVMASVCGKCARAFGRCFCARTSNIPFVPELDGSLRLHTSDGRLSVR